MSTLYVVSTPIGNLEDITLRAIRTLKEVDLVLAEDTRVAKRLLQHHGIEKDVVRYDEHKHKVMEDMVLEALREGTNIALISDAGTPTISDPGYRLIARILEIKREIPEINIKSIPGPSSLTSALSLSGISADHFVFYGFLPTKKGKETIIKDISEAKRTSVFFESPNRIMKTLEMMKKFIDWERKISVVREISKIHEDVVTGSIREVIDYFEKHPDQIRGEMVVVVESL
ncbi:16S rRNA (cytidine(1402)-2'-O)-methyltransferase [Candidatus Campbellbacteria bacterium CG22_combo_CG10-13_8_21_14_all_36_13]|uniref:Ribosomal RNA small subunit methyltransferase I n=1 Tax=Candidatus Campbellbacteria bacterium CG22_combo_CG10-13_8_21_14_all_36_13 TaxID=1974529 RepID=A0A2H0DYR0_9BACT|nr:MAG: 16S rRNA (cytidine(1402)-2'-O)-methyltransferase [Candidatus Campbellbacteria bacterium CG22_combo_CG10-13_8_21_14_all_36_13]